MDVLLLAPARATDPMLVLGMPVRVTNDEPTRGMTGNFPESVLMSPRPIVRFEVFRGTFASWNQLFEQAAEFASHIGRERLISISHSEDKDDGVVAVWYWDVQSNQPRDP
jgi:hypothetical protein